MAFGKLPVTMHLTVTGAVAATADEFGPALTEAVAAARARGPVELPAQLIEAAGTLRPEMVTPELVAGLAEGLALGAGGFSRMAQVNTLLKRGTAGAAGGAADRVPQPPSAARSPHGVG